MNPFVQVKFFPIHWPTFSEFTFVIFMSLHKIHNWPIICPFFNFYFVSKSIIDSLGYQTWTSKIGLFYFVQNIMFQIVSTYIYIYMIFTILTLTYNNLQERDLICSSLLIFIFIFIYTEGNLFMQSFLLIFELVSNCMFVNADCERGLKQERNVHLHVQIT